MESVSYGTSVVVNVVGVSLILIGSLCNIVVIWTISKSRSLYRCSINRTVLHLSLTSLLDLLVNVPLTLLIVNLNYFKIQPFEWICSMEILQQSLITTIQLFFISIIGIERLLSIVNPYDRDSNLQRINILIGFVWCSGIFISILTWYFFPTNVVVYFCNGRGYEDFYRNFLYVHQPIGLVALVITIISYSGIVARVFHIRSTKSKMLNRNQFFRHLSAPVTVGAAPAAASSASTTVNPFGKVSTPSSEMTLHGQEFFCEREVPKLRLSSKLYERRKKIRRQWKNRKNNATFSQVQIATSLPSIQINEPSPEECQNESPTLPVSPLSLHYPSSLLSPGVPSICYSFSEDESIDKESSVIQRKRRLSTSPGVFYDPNYLAPPILNDPEIYMQKSRGSSRRHFSTSSSESLQRVDFESEFSFSSRGSFASSNSSTFLSKSPSPTRARRMELTTTLNSFIIVLVFAVLWSPFPVAVLYLDETQMEWQLLSFCLGMISSFTNPILYGLSIKAFQKELRKLNEKRIRKNNVQRFKKENI